MAVTITATLNDTVTTDLNGTGATPGDTLTYEVTITNASDNVTARAVQLADLAHNFDGRTPSVNLVGDTDSADCAAEEVTVATLEYDKALVCRVGDLAPHASKTITYVLTPTRDGALANPVFARENGLPLEPEGGQVLESDALPGR